MYDNSIKSRDRINKLFIKTNGDKYRDLVDECILREKIAEKKLDMEYKMKKAEMTQETKQRVRSLSYGKEKAEWAKLEKKFEQMKPVKANSRMQKYRAER